MFSYLITDYTAGKLPNPSIRIKPVDDQGEESEILLKVRDQQKKESRGRINYLFLGKKTPSDKVLIDESNIITTTDEEDEDDGDTSETDLDDLFEAK